ncbi:unnamed protein product [Cochlearia groenlandica]
MKLKRCVSGVHQAAEQGSVGQQATALPVRDLSAVWGFMKRLQELHRGSDGHLECDVKTDAKGISVRCVENHDSIMP